MADRPTPAQNAKERAKVASAVREFLNSGYSQSAANLTKPVFKGWEWQGGSPDDDIIANLPIIRQRSRQLSMEAPIIAGLYETKTTNTVGSGLRLEPTPDADYLNMSPQDAQKWKSQVMRTWEMFAESKACDYRRTNNFYDLTRLVARSRDESGDVFVTLPMIDRNHDNFALKMHVIEADCIDDPKDRRIITDANSEHDTFGGVETDQFGQVIAYWISVKHPLQRRWSTSSIHRHDDWVRITAQGEESGRANILHIMNTVRPGQRRGVPLVAPIIELCLILDRYMKAEATAAQIQALFTLVITSKSDPGTIPGELDALHDSDVAADDDSLITLGPGVVRYAREGEEIVPVNPTRPTSVYQNFIESTLQMMGPAIKMPYELLLQKFDSSYSASRAALNMANAGFKVEQAALVNNFCQPVYEAFMDEAVARGMIHAPSYWTDPIARRAYTRAKWNGPALPQIDPLKEIMAASKQVELGVKTLSQATSELTGGDWYENVAELERELKTAKKAGMVQLTIDDIEIDTDSDGGVAPKYKEKKRESTDAEPITGDEPLSDDEAPFTLNGAQVTAVITIIEAVNEGTMGHDAAVKLLTSAFGFDEATAQEILED